MKHDYPRDRSRFVVWTPEADADIIRLWGDGKITREIAEFIGTTRNAILGRLHRLRINGADIHPRVPARRNSLADKEPKQRCRATGVATNKKSPSVAFPESAKRIAKIPRVLPKPKTIPTGNLCSIVDLTGCKYPVSEGEKIIGKYLFCNAEKRHEVPYCEHHAAVVVRQRP